MCTQIQIGVDEKTPENYLPLRHGVTMLLAVIGAVFILAALILGALHQQGVSLWARYITLGVYGVLVGLVVGVSRGSILDVVCRNIIGYSRWTFPWNFAEHELVSFIGLRGKVPFSIQNIAAPRADHAIAEALGGWFNRDGVYHRLGEWDRSVRIRAAKKHPGTFWFSVRGSAVERMDLREALDRINDLPIWNRHRRSFVEWRALRKHCNETVLAYRSAQEHIKERNRIIETQTNELDIARLALNKANGRIEALTGNLENYMQFVRRAITLLLNSSRAIASKEVQEVRATLLAILPADDPLREVKPPQRQRTKRGHTGL